MLEQDLCLLLSQVQMELIKPATKPQPPRCKNSSTPLCLSTSRERAAGLGWELVVPQSLHRILTDKSGPGLVPRAGHVRENKEMPAAREAPPGVAGVCAGQATQGQGQGPCRNGPRLANS